MQDKLKPQYPFTQGDPRRQKLCCYFEVRDDVLEAAYSGSNSGIYIKKDITGGRGFGLFFAARLDYVEFFDPDTLESVVRASAGVQMALAVFVGKTRLIDNATL